jgi:predicted dienelactone hydrolase
MLSGIFFAQGLDSQTSDLPVRTKSGEVSRSFRGVRSMNPESTLPIVVMDSGPAPSKSAVADLANDIAELG